MRTAAPDARKDPGPRLSRTAAATRVFELVHGEQMRRSVTDELRYALADAIMDYGDAAAREVLDAWLRDMRR